MATNLFIRGIERPIKPGHITTRVLSQTLDTAHVIIPQIAEFDIEPMDEVVLGSQYAYVASIRRKLATFTPVKLWNYEVGLISPVIKLQRIVVPNRSITQPITGTKKTIYQVMSEYKTIYAPWLVFNQDLIDITTGMTAPELQWNQPTLFEMYNDLLSVVGCVITMTDFTHAGILDLNARGSEIDESKLNNMEASQSIEEYANELEVDAKNAVYPDMNIQTYERLVLKTTQSSILTVDNAELILAKDIFQIHKVDCQFVDEELYTEDDIINLDITDYIAEKTVYNTYKTSNSLDVITAKDYKRNALYYTEGSNIISGFGYNDDAILGIDTRRAIINIVVDAGSLVPIDILTNQMFDMTFGVWYTSTEDIKFTVKKTVDTVTDSVLINNQETSHTDIRALVKKNQDTVNRIGNELVIIYGRYSDIADVPELGDTMGDYVLTLQTVKHHIDGYDFSGELTEHYVMENMFTAIKNSIRYSAIASANKAFLSEHLNKYTIIASTSIGSNYGIFEKYLINFARTGYYPKLVVANVVYGDNDTREFLMNPSVHWFGNNTIRMNVRMPDNYSAGIRVEKKTIFYVSDKYSVLDTPYVDSNGEFEAIELLVYKDFSNPNLTAATEELRSDALDRARSYPLVTEGLLINPDDIIFDTDLLYRYKDNREITSETLQFYHISDSNVGIGDAYYQNSVLTYMGDSDIPLYIWVSSTELYTVGDQIAHGSNVSGVVRINNSIRTSLLLSVWEALNVMSWAVADALGNIYFWVNGNERTLYLKSEYVYNPVTYDLGDLVITGSISATYEMGNDYQLLDLVIQGLVASSYIHGDDYLLDDLVTQSVISANYEEGDNYFLNDFVIQSAVSSYYESLPDYALTGLVVQSVISESYEALIPDSYAFTDLVVQSVISESYTYYGADGYTLDNIVVQSINSSDYIKGGDYQISSLVAQSINSSAYEAIIPAAYTLADFVARSVVGSSLTYDAPPYYDWLPGGAYTQPIGLEVCVVADDVGNVRCEIVGTSCGWVQIDVYFSSTNQTGGDTTCFDGAERTICSYAGGGQWLCGVEEAVIENVYDNCEVCTEIEQ